MKAQALLGIALFAAASTALAAPTCVGAEVVQGNNCALTVSLAWATAGLGTDSIVTTFVPPNASGPVTFHITGLSSSLGSTYKGYFGVRAGDPGEPDTMVVTLADILAGFDFGELSPGEMDQARITPVCWDPTCTSPAPAGAVPNMFSLQLVISSPNPADINPNSVQATIRFLDGNRVTFQTAETGIRSNSQYKIIPGVNLGATPEGRYVYTGSAVNQPFDAISVSNLNNPNTISGTVTLQDPRGTVVATAAIPSIPPGGAAGYLLIGRTPGDPLGLFPSSTVLPAGPDGVFRGTVVVGMAGLTATGQCIVLAQEYNGNSMLNLRVFDSNVP